MEVEIVDAMPVAQAGQLYAMTAKSELEAAIDAAHRYKRSISSFREEVRSMALLNPETAQQMGYAKPQAGGTVKGPSTRLAEIVATAWGNLRYGFRVIETTDDTITAEAFCFDCEKNTGAKVTETKSIVGKNGRYKPDMIVTTGKAACSIALRNAIFRVVPKVYVDEIYNEAMAVAYGQSVSLADVRQKCFMHVRGLGVTDDRILAVVKRPGIADVTMEDVATLRALCVTIKEGELTVEQAFPFLTAEPAEGEAPKEAPKAGTKSRVKDKLKADAPQQTNPEPQDTALTAEELAEYNSAMERDDR